MIALGIKFMFCTLAMGTNGIIHMGIKGRIEVRNKLDYSVYKLLYTVLLFCFSVNIKYGNLYVIQNNGSDGFCLYDTKTKKISLFSYKWSDAFV